MHGNRGVKFAAHQIRVIVIPATVVGQKGMLDT